MKINSELTLHMELDAEEAMVGFYKYFNMADKIPSNILSQNGKDYEELMQRVSDAISKKSHMKTLFTEYMRCEVKYGYILCIKLFPALFDDKRFITRIKKCTK